MPVSLLDVYLPWEEQREQWRRVRTVSPYERRKLAASGVLSPRTQTVLSEDSRVDVRAALAGNALLLRTVQVTLAKDRNEQVRRQLARSKVLHPEAAAILGGDEKEYVQRYLASNPLTPPEVLAGLGASPYGNVLMRLGGNTSTPESTLFSLATNLGVRVSVAANPSATLQVLRLLPARIVHVGRLRALLSDDPRWETIWALHPEWSGTLGELLDVVGELHPIP